MDGGFPQRKDTLALPLETDVQNTSDSGHEDSYRVDGTLGNTVYTRCQSLSQDITESGTWKGNRDGRGSKRLPQRLEFVEVDSCQRHGRQIAEG